jgi:hypothetical protein
MYFVLFVVKKAFVAQCHTMGRYAFQSELGAVT